MEQIEQIARAVLYEGYLLYPYSRSALKNQQRWTFGGVYPREYSEATGENDPWLMQTQCILRGDENTTLDVRVRFLQVTDRAVMSARDGTWEPIEELRIGGRIYHPWEEARERTVGAPSLTLGSLLACGTCIPIRIRAGDEEEALSDDTGARGRLVRSWHGLHGGVVIESEVLGRDAYRVTVRIVNTTPCAERDRAPVIRHTLVSTHTVLTASNGEFISLLEPPEEYEAAAAGCENIKTWPVLIGAPGERGTMLSSPIILYDYPAVSPETPGDLFDATEIDELLRLSIMSLTDAEKEEMRDTDERSRAILEQTEALTVADLMNLHASVRRLGEEQL